ncbi:MAG: electron transport complex subunit RsxA [Planctomycetota bacterium]|jgi:electron transport complex protein RnfA|nr:electron transport complex subunit RsxA [Planctomycetota bacterium]
MKEYFVLMFGMVFVQNFVLNQFLGICPFIGVSKKRDAALGMGMAVVFVMGLSCFVTMLVYKLLLLPYGLASYLDIMSFILIIAALVQFVEIVMRKLAPDLYRALGIYLPLISTNCAVLGSTQMRVIEFAGLPLPEALLKNTALGVFGGIGFTLALFLMASLRERLEFAPLPQPLRGIPIAFLTAAGMSIAFFAFTGIV